MKRTLIIMCLLWKASVAMLPADSVATDSTRVLFSIDSTAIKGSDYGSFADLWLCLPLAYVYDRGSVGQPAYPALGTSHAGHALVIYDDLVLNDPLTKKIDLNLVPTESIAAAWLPFSASDLNGHTTAPARTVFLRSIDIAAQPVRSQVGYRTGDTGIDDVDVRLGIKMSPQQSLNAGALLKNYAGTTSHSKYRTQKVNVKLTRALRNNWWVRYNLLYNNSDLDLALGLNRPWSPPDVQTRTLSDEKLSRPHEKRVRFDHGLSFWGPHRFKAILQFTDLYQELYGYRHTVVDQTLEAQKISLSTTVNPQWDFLNVIAGASMRWIRPDFGFTHARNDWESTLSLALQKRLGNIEFSLASRLENSNQSTWQVLPYLSARLNSIRIWLEKDQRLPSLLERYSDGPFALGNTELIAQNSWIVGTGWQQKTDAWQGSLSVMAEKVTDPLGIGLSSSVPVYRNGKDQTQVCLHWQGTLAILSWLHVTCRWQEYRLEGDQMLVKRPERWAQGGVRARHVFFQGDLDVTLYIGADYFDSVSIYDPFFSDFHGYDSHTSDATIYPYVHARFIIGDAALYAAFHNIMANDLSIWPDFPEPKAELRWGIVWSFVD
ncbi:hypothetical protein GF406_08550 [candidate division KSB1 bacterium]|nr:hypothetical protein [candidate division KSB1 bacterium]